MTDWTLADAYELLAVAQSFDRRTVGDFDAEGWRRAMHDLDLDDAKQAIVEHYTSSSDWLMPAHVRTGVKRLRADRLERAPYAIPAADPDDVAAYLADLRAQRHRQAAGLEQRDLRAIEQTFPAVPDARPKPGHAPPPPGLARRTWDRVTRRRELTHGEAVADMDQMLADRQPPEPPAVSDPPSTLTGQPERSTP